ncbi:glycoside hydrolase family 16 protein [Prolixibacteraceae bacterium Z1-6]|uniref:Glycoside hydrolase family 16 protein n=1 Tax=Draconibacterium aestuarii TaxID=2998507 RepID=A0A9X3J4H8_9BACT|nr:glycoside hydrolase family 16 protein [Prolixibacteraceae bacterium Z1-6]
MFRFLLASLMLLTSCCLNSCSANDDLLSEKENSQLPSHIKATYKLFWSDEFEGSDIDLKKWNYRAEGSTRKYGVVSRQTIALDGNGNVTIKVLKDNDGKYFIGQLGTQGLFETTYGYFECRAKMNKELGPHIAFWLQSPEVGNTSNNPQEYGAEVDIFEYHMKEPDTVHHNIHWNGYGDTHKSTGAKINLSDLKNGFHTFGLEWTKDEYVFYVDGIETWRTSTAVSHRSEYIILSTELTGWGGDPQSGNFPDEVVFDYVRVYKPKQ